MSVTTYTQLASHQGHEIECVVYGQDDGVNAALECVTCGEVLIDFDNEEGAPDQS